MREKPVSVIYSNGVRTIACETRQSTWLLAGRRKKNACSVARARLLRPVALLRHGAMSGTGGSTIATRAD